jgi:type VI secretion system protein VasJ
LSEKSKDLQIAAYLAVALWQNRGTDGLLPGIQVMADLLRGYWQTAWPPLKRIRGRVNAVDWWHEKTGAYLQSLREQDIVLDTLYCRQLLDALQNLEGQRDSLLPDATPLRDLAALVERLSGSSYEGGESGENASESSPEPPPGYPQDQARQSADTAAAAAPGKSAANPAGVSGPVPASAPQGDAAALHRQFVDAGLNYLPLARQITPADPAPWRLLRLIVWSSITALPPMEDGRTLLPTPDKTQLDAAAHLLATGKALEAALAAEDMFVTAPFYLDVQFLVHKSLLASGSSYAAAADTVQEECARFALRLPGVERLRFTDDAAFASPETIAWLTAAARQMKGGGGDTKALEVSAAGGQALRQARKLQAQSDISGALDTLDAAKTSSPAMNLRLRTEQLRILCDAQENDAATALAKNLLKETEERALDNWDPDLALEALLAVRQALTLFDAQNTDALHAAQSRIARLKPAAILKGALL